MKLTAPPPPPPVPDQDGGSQLSANQPPVANEPPTPPQEAPPPAPKVVAWPSWFSGADVIMGLLVVSLAFLVSSFVARNTDIWLHMAAGKRLLAGEYKPGTDPFSYSAADRTWVNHYLLYDVGTYLLYGGDGVALSVAKALIFSLAFGLLMAIRRPGFSFWPWAGVTALAILAAAPRGSVLSPIVGSCFLLATTLFLLFRMPHRPGSWRFPIAIGVTFWVWAQTDAWFILGPLTLALALVGEVVQRWLNKRQDEATAMVDPLGAAPNVSTLAKALAVGVLACMLNPHHVLNWQLPIELIESPSKVADPRIRQALLITPFDKLYLDSPMLGYNWNGLAYGILLAGGGALLGIGMSMGRVRATPLLLWVAFALLSFKTVIAIPFFAIAAVPLLAAELNLLSTGVTLRGWNEPRTRLVLWGSAVGRVLCLVVITAACVLAWPGWMHPESFYPAFNRRVAWGVEPDPGLVQAAKQIQDWRASGRLPAEARGFIASTELANYVAWYAPLEKVYFNGDYAHHARELEFFTEVRSDLGLVPRDEPVTMADLGRAIDKLGASYVVLAGTQGDFTHQRLGLTQVAIQFTDDAEHWATWYLDGRVTILGRQADGRDNAAFAALKLDPVALAFGPGVERLPEAKVKPAPLPEGWEGEFLHGAGMAPIEADEAMGWARYHDRLLYHQEAAEMISVNLFRSVGGINPIHQGIIRKLEFPRRPPPPTIGATAVLSLRAARRAIASAPDHPDGYYALYIAATIPELPLSPSERYLTQVTALSQCLKRLPPPERYRRNVYIAPAYEAAHKLALLYWGEERGRPMTANPAGLTIDMSAIQGVPAFRTLWVNPQLTGGITGIVMTEQGPKPFLWPENGPPPGLQVVSGPNFRAVDLARDFEVLAGKYAEVELNPDKDETRLKELKATLKAMETDLVNNDKAYTREKSGPPMKLARQVQLALRNHLAGEALKLLTDPSVDLRKEYSPESGDLVDALLIRLALELAVGRLEDAAADLEDMPKVVDTLPPSRRYPPGFQKMSLLQLQYVKAVFEGNYKQAGELVETWITDERALQDIPPSPGQASFNRKPFAKLNPDKTFARLSPDFFIQLFDLAATGPFQKLLETPRNPMYRELLRPYLERQELLRARRAFAGEFFYRRGLLSLLEGDIASARRRFQQTQQSGDEEWGVFDFTHPSATYLLRLIDGANHKP